MNYVDHLNNFEIFKMANELACEIYPSEFEEKETRDMLIDFKDVLRKTLKNKTKIISHEKADILLKYMNPKRKWPWSRLETFNVIYEIQPNFEVFSNLLEASSVDLQNTNEELIFKYLIVNEVYDRSVLRFLFKVYDLDLPNLCEPFVDSSEDLFTEDDLKTAKKNLKSGNFKITEAPLFDKGDDLLDDDIDLDDIDIDIDIDIENIGDIENIDDIDDIDDLGDIDEEFDEIELDEEFEEDFEEEVEPKKSGKKKK